MKNICLEFLLVLLGFSAITGIVPGWRAFLHSQIPYLVINDVSILHNGGSFDSNTNHPKRTSRKSNTSTYELPSTSCQPHNLIGRIKYKPVDIPDEIDCSAIQIPIEVAAKMQNSSYSPTQFENCTIPEGQSVAIIIPFRDDDSKGNSRRGVQVNYFFLSSNTSALYVSSLYNSNSDSTKYQIQNFCRHSNRREFIQPGETAQYWFQRR